MDIHNAVAIVTGAGRVDDTGNPRIGNAIALALAMRKARVLVHYSSSKEGAESTVATIRNFGGEAFAFQADLADENVGEKIVSEAIGRFGAPVRILINSAAIFPTDDILSFDAQKTIQTLKIMSIGPSLLMQSMVKAIPNGTGGVIINIIDSRIGNRPYPDHYSYAMAKAALSEASTSIALALAGRNIRVVRISPGAILKASGKSDTHHQHVLRTVPLGHEGGNDSIVKAVLCVIENDFVTGSNIVVDGGGFLL
ncbi:MAG: SDR family oxidoreductase [Candidatus Moranbacteria bacterium]|nr:SDR family oxidoreductase [Candidatus Moranbacteria bacterium]